MGMDSLMLGFMLKYVLESSLLLTRSLVLASEDVRSHHGSHPSQTYAYSYIVNDPIAGLQEEPGQDHQNRDDKAVQQLKCSQ